MKHIITFGLMLASVCSLAILLLTNGSESAALNQYVELAKQYDEDELYIKAIENYQNAISLSENNYEYKLAVIQDYEKLEDYDSAISLAETVVSTNSDKIDCYYILLDYYKSNNKYTDFISLLKKAYQLFPNDEKIEEYEESLDTWYEVDSSYYTDITMFFHDRAIAYGLFLDDEGNQKKRYSVVDGDGSLISSDNVYENMKFTDQINNYLVMDAEKGLEVINADGYPTARNVEVASSAAIQVQFEGCAAVESESRYYLLNSELKKSKAAWDFVGTFSDGLAPVKKGNQWGIMSADNISSDGIEWKYEDIVLDEFGRCLCNDRMFVKKDGKYSLLNGQMETVTETAFEDADMFVSEQPAAVKIDGKWGFVSMNGEIVIQPEYEEAHSFANGYAAVKKNNKWGLINSSNKIVVEPQYEEIKYMSAEGKIPVKDESSYWNFLTMFKLYYSGEE